MGNTAPIKNNVRPRATTPVFITPKNQQVYLGTVVERFEDNVTDSESAPRNYKIKFNILGLPEFVDEYPIAIPLGNSTRPCEIGDTVKIYDIFLMSTGLHTFYYEQIFEDRFTGIKNYDNVIDMTEKNVSRIKLPNLEIIMDRHEGFSGGSDQDDLGDTAGGVTIKLPGCEITYSNDEEKVTTLINFEEDFTIEKKVKKTFKKEIEVASEDKITASFEKEIGVSSDDKIEIESGKEFTIKSGLMLKLEAGGPVDIKATGSAKINFTPGSVGFCALPNCLLTGAPHTTGTGACS